MSKKISYADAEVALTKLIKGIEKLSPQIKPEVLAMAKEITEVLSRSQQQSVKVELPSYQTPVGKLQYELYTLAFKITGVRKTVIKILVQEGVLSPFLSSPIDWIILAGALPAIGRSVEFARYCLSLHPKKVREQLVATCEETDKAKIKIMQILDSNPSISQKGLWKLLAQRCQMFYIPDFRAYLKQQVRERKRKLSRREVAELKLTWPEIDAENKAKQKALQSKYSPFATAYRKMLAKREKRKAEERLTDLELAWFIKHLENAMETCSDAKRTKSVANALKGKRVAKEAKFRELFSLLGVEPPQPVQELIHALIFDLELIIGNSSSPVCAQARHYHSSLLNLKPESDDWFNLLTNKIPLWVKNRMALLVPENTFNYYECARTLREIKNGDFDQYDINLAKTYLEEIGRDSTPHAKKLEIAGWAAIVAPPPEKLLIQA